MSWWPGDDWSLSKSRSTKLKLYAFGCTCPHHMVGYTALISSVMQSKGEEDCNHQEKTSSASILSIYVRKLIIDHRGERLGAKQHQSYDEAGAGVLSSCHRSSNDPLQKHQLRNLQFCHFSPSVFLLDFLWNDLPENTCWSLWNSKTSSWLL